MNGTLYIIPTPIGNLGDITRRAAEVMSMVDVIACEDTRTSSVLLRHLGISKPLVSFHQHNEHRKVADLIQRLKNGEQIALISDAGTPGISDPGFLAVRQAHIEGIQVIALPGPSAAITALVGSGLPCDRFAYEGFLPPKKGRKTRMQQIAMEDRTIILFESPHRIKRLLADIVEHCGEGRIVAVARELTKKFEEIVRGSAADVLREFSGRESVKGEIVVIISGNGYTE
ncbi:MAG: 16S rRNA (cytidine(1402)-2'-O)-methyltransferase [Balneolaceae bacterium]|nr:MAG: 16S rRNA (cytidine(1402)-2'-O)-methyltransferase [Balneolaceae bacterium]